MCKMGHGQRILGENKLLEDSDLSHRLDKIEAMQEYIIKCQEKLEQLVTTILDVVEDAMLKSQVTDCRGGSPHRTKRTVADISPIQSIHGEASIDPSSITTPSIAESSEEVISKKLKQMHLTLLHNLKGNVNLIM
jgi:hypothetical protein